MSKNRNQNSGARNENAPPPTPEKRRPVHTIRRWCGAGCIDVAIFEKQSEGQNSRLAYFASATKSYKDDKGEYQNVSVFNPHELLVLAHAVTEAYEWMNAQNDRQ